MAEKMTSVEDHKWLDPECGQCGCQSLNWQARYESAVRGRKDFRDAYRRAREDNHDKLVEALELARHELWRLGCSESEDGALWRVRAALASLQSQEGQSDA